MFSFREKEDGYGLDQLKCWPPSSAPRVDRSTGGCALTVRHEEQVARWQPLKCDSFLCFNLSFLLWMPQWRRALLITDALWTHSAGRDPVAFLKQKSRGSLWSSGGSRQYVGCQWRKHEFYTHTGLSSSHLHHPVLQFCSANTAPCQDMDTEVWDRRPDILMDFNIGTAAALLLLRLTSHHRQRFYLPSSSWNQSCSCEFLCSLHSHWT